MRFQIAKRPGRRPEARPDFVQVGENVIIGSAVWTGENGRRQERYQVLRFRDGQIVDMQGCRSRREAERYSRLRA